MAFTGETLSWRRHDTHLEVELHRAPLNEIGTTTLAELELLVRHLEAGAEGARALVVWSSRPGFCAGADLRELHAGIVAAKAARSVSPLQVRERLAAEGVRRGLRKFLDRIHAVFDALDQAPLPVIAAVNGLCFGGGFELALTADVVVADRTARFCFPELRLGLIPGFGGIPRLARDVGNAVVRDLLLTGRSLNAARAHEVGLVSQLVPKGEALAAARATAAQLGRFDPHVARAGKAFAKPFPGEWLAREKETFVALATRPEVLAALDRFVNDKGVRPYLPADRGGDS
jgi:enoyl-CoA hydratase/carnithine racemase